MDAALLDFHTDLQNAHDTESAWDLLLKFVSPLGIRHVHTWFGTTLEDVCFRTTCPDWWIPYYMENALWKHDPIKKHCESRSDSIIYGVDKYGNCPPGMEQALSSLNFMKNELDLGSGIGHPTFAPGGRRVGGFNLGISGTLEKLRRMPVQNLVTAAMAATAVQTRSHLMDSLGLRTLSLTPRERECLLWLAAGLRTKEISAKLKLTDHTIKFHIDNAKARLGAETREQAVARAVALGLITP